MLNVETCSSMFETMLQSLATTKCASSLTAKIYLLLAIQALSNLVAKRPSFFAC